MPKTWPLHIAWTKRFASYLVYPGSESAWRLCTCSFESSSAAYTTFEKLLLRHSRELFANVGIGQQIAPHHREGRRFFDSERT